MIRKFIAIKSLLMAALLGGIALLSICSCATMPTESLSAGEVRLVSITVEDNHIKANAPTVVEIKFEADGRPEIIMACFSFSGKGPYCTGVRDYTYGSPGMIRVQTSAVIAKKISELNLRALRLEGHILYEREGKREPSNVVSTFVQVHKAR